MYQDIFCNRKHHWGCLYIFFISKLLTEQKGFVPWSQILKFIPLCNDRARLILRTQNDDQDDALSMTWNTHLVGFWRGVLWVLLGFPSHSARLAVLTGCEDHMGGNDMPTPSVGWETETERRARTGTSFWQHLAYLVLGTLQTRQHR